MGGGALLKPVDRIANGIRDALLEYAPRVPKVSEYNAIVARVVDECGYVLIRQGNDADWKPFIQVQPKESHQPQITT